MARHCTVPKILGFRDWFEERFGELCKQHDETYIAQQGGEVARLMADLRLTSGMWSRGYWWFAIPTQAFLTGLGWYWWWFKD